MSAPTQYRLTAEEKERALERATALRERLAEKARHDDDDEEDHRNVVMQGNQVTDLSEDDT